MQGKNHSTGRTTSSNQSVTTANQQHIDYPSYNTTLRAIIPLPDPNAHPDSPEHLNAYPLFVAGSTVMALYPDTSCFYRAEVIASPKDMLSTPRNGPIYKLKFEDDDDQEHTVMAQWVVEWPGGT